MTDTTLDGSAVEAVAELARAGTAVTEVTDGVYAVADSNGEVTLVDLKEQLRLARGLPPVRKSGKQVVHDPEAFVAYLGKHALSQTEVWADALTLRLTAVINADSPTAAADDEGQAGHRDHTVVWTAPLTDAWKAWQDHDGDYLDQEAMAEHFEDRTIDIVSEFPDGTPAPSAADLLELAQTLKATKSVQFEGGRRLKSGETTLAWKETVDGTGGKSGQLPIPDAFALILAPFEGSDAHVITARFRYRISPSGLRLKYVLDRPDDVMRAAFNGVAQRVEADSGLPVWAGAVKG